MDLQTKVLICGAGPTGLMMACQLKRFGIDCIVIDEKIGIVKETRALAVQARTLQIYEQMGLVEKVLEQGTAAKSMKLIINAAKVYEIPLHKLGKGLSAYPFLFVFTQDKNEQLLYDHLKTSGGDVLWQHTFESFSQNNDEVIAIVKDAGGNKKQIKAEWLAGADGGKSIIRHQLQVPFGGGTYENIFYVADTATDWLWGHDCLSLCLSAKTFTALFPMKGDNRFRLVGIFPKKFDPNQIHDFSIIQKTVQEQMKMKINFTNTSWFSVYKVHHRCVNNFTHGRVFLAGDAAHVHSPAGGQGMNTGLQDAYNLAWKLALVVNNFANKKLLESYNEERLPVAKRLVQTTDRAFSFITSQNKGLRFLRLYILPFFIKVFISINKLGALAYKTISQLGINYHSSSISYSSNTHLLKAGSLVPFTNINAKPVNDILKFNGFTLLLFNYEMKEGDADKLRNDFNKLLQIVSVARSQINIEAYSKFKVKTTAAFLIRPDNYIGYCAEKILVGEIKKYLVEKLHIRTSL